MERRRRGGNDRRRLQQGDGGTLAGPIESTALQLAESRVAQQPEPPSATVITVPAPGARMAARDTRAEEQLALEVPSTMAPDPPFILLRRFYDDVSPGAKTNDDLHKVVAQFAGREERLYQYLLKKYGKDPRSYAALSQTTATPRMAPASMRLREDEEIFFATLWRDGGNATPGQGTIAARQVVALLERSGLPRKTLRVLWECVDGGAKGHLTSAEFCAALRLAAAAQLGESVGPSASERTDLSLVRVQDAGTAKQATLTVADDTKEKHAVSFRESITTQTYNPEEPIDADAYKRARSDFKQRRRDRREVQADQGAAPAAQDADGGAGSGSAYRDDEEALFSRLWSKASNGSSSVGATAAVALFGRFGLPKKVLRVVWRLSDKGKSGALDQGEFYGALRLVAAAQQDPAHVSGEMAERRDLPLPVEQGAAPAAQDADGGAGSGSAYRDDEEALFSRLWSKASNGSSSVGATAAVALFGRFGLPKTVLRVVWRLSDKGKSGALSKGEFYGALRLLAAAQQDPAHVLGEMAERRDLPLPVEQGAKTQPWITERELQYFSSLHQRVYPKGRVVKAREVVQFLAKSGLNRRDLRTVWSLADTKDAGSLDLDSFCVALKLVALAQNGHVIDRANLGEPTPLPSMGDASKTAVEGSVMSSFHA